MADATTLAKLCVSVLRTLQDHEAQRTAFIASLEKAVAKGDREGFSTSDEVGAELASVTEAARLREA